MSTLRVEFLQRFANVAICVEIMRLQLKNPEIFRIFKQMISSSVPRKVAA